MFRSEDIGEMAEPQKGRKPTLREIMDEIAEDEELGEKEREMAREMSE